MVYRAGIPLPAISDPSVIPAKAGMTGKEVGNDGRKGPGTTIFEREAESAAMTTCPRPHSRKRQP